MWTRKGEEEGGEASTAPAGVPSPGCPGGPQGDRPGNEWASPSGVHPALLHGWKKLLLTAAASGIDWSSRFVVSWRLSNTLEGMYCLGMLEEALAQGHPEIFNTDQGAPFTAEAFPGRLEQAGVAVNRDGRGRCLGNAFVGRRWRTVTYDDVYPKSDETGAELGQGLRRYFAFSNEERSHQALGYRSPAAVYREGTASKPGGDSEGTPFFGLDNGGPLHS